MAFDRYTVALLVRPDDAPELSDKELAELQDRHLAHGALAVERGLKLAAGPFDDQDDERFRGFSVWRADRETVREHLAQDPSVLAGRLQFRLMTWLVPAGNISFHPVRHPRSMAEAAG